MASRVCEPAPPSQPPPWAMSSNQAGTSGPTCASVGTCMIVMAKRGLTDQAIADGPAEQGLGSVEAELGAIEVDDPGPLSRSEHGAGLVDVAGEGLLADDVPACGDRFEHQRPVGERRGGDHHGVDVGQLQRVAQGGERRRGPP